MKMIIITSIIILIVLGIGKLVNKFFRFVFYSAISVAGGIWFSHIITVNFPIIFKLFDIPEITASLILITFILILTIRCWILNAFSFLKVFKIRK